MTGAPSGPNKLAADAVTAGVTTRARARAWLDSRHLPIADRLAPVLGGLWTDGFVVGAVSSRTVLAHHGLIVKADTNVATVTMGAEWGRWTPGDEEAARELLGAEGMGDGLQALLEHGGIVLKGIEDHKLDQLAGILAGGVARGDAPATIAQAIRALVDDPKWAYRVALTETTRAVSSATLWRYARNGVEAKEWMTAGDQHVCVPCNVNEDQGALPLDMPFADGNDAPPSHPLCRCSLAPAWLTVEEAAAQGADLAALGLGAAGETELGGVTRTAEDILGGEAEGEAAARRAAPGADTPAQISAAQAVEIRDALANARTIKDIEQAFADEARVITGRRIPAWFGDEASPLTAREHAEGVLRVLERFPDADLKRLTWVRDPDFFAEAHLGQIRFSSVYSDTGGRARYLRQLAKGVEGWKDDYDWRSSFSFRGSANPAATAVHEMGHILELDTIGPSLAGRVETLVDDMADRLNLQPVSLIRRQVSGYATTNTTELIAEAFGDAILNGDAASELSRGIFDLIVQEYEAGNRVYFSAQDLAEEEGTGWFTGRAAPKLVGPAADDLSRQTMAQLRALAKDRGLTGYSKLTKPQLLERLAGEARPVDVKPPTVAEQRAALRAAARERNALIESRTKVADTLAELDELVAKKASADAIAERLSYARATDVLPAKDLDALAKVAADPAKLRAAVTRIGKKNGITFDIAAGQSTTFAPAAHESVAGIDIAEGAKVTVVRRGATLTLPDGSTMRLTRAWVRTVDEMVADAFPSRVGPSIRELMDAAPTFADYYKMPTLADRQKIVEAAKEPIAKAIDGVYGGLEVRVKEVSAYEHTFMSIRGEIRDPATGRKVGNFTRHISRENSGELVAHHDLLTLGRAYRGSGFADKFNENLYAWYRRSGIARVELHANIDVGGYAWAVKGYEFEGAATADHFVDKSLVKVRDALAKASPPKGVTGQQLKDLETYLSDVKAGRTPARAFDISQFGRKPGQGGRTAVWAGKWLMLKSDWYGALHL